MQGKWDKETIKNGILLVISAVLIVFIFANSIFGGAGRVPSESDDVPQNESEDNRGEKDPLKAPDGLEGKTVITWNEFLFLCRIFDYDEPQISDSAQQNPVLCGEFCDVLVSICRSENLDYKLVFASLPERLATVKESDELYYEEFMEVYETLLEMLSEKEGRITKKDVFVLMTKENGFFDENGRAYSCRQRQQTDSLFSCRNQVISGYFLEDELILYSPATEKETLLTNAWLLRGTKESITVLLSGYTVEIPLSLAMEQKWEKVICDILVSEGEVQNLSIKEDRIEGKVLRFSEEELELEGYGILPVSDRFKVYRIYGEPACENKKHILTGYSITDFVVENGTVCAGLIKEKLRAETIRVLLHTSGFQSLFHTEVVLTAECDFLVETTKEKRKYSAGEELVLTWNRMRAEEERMVIRPLEKDGKITLCSVERLPGNPSYRGSLEIIPEQEGFLVINEVLLEEYLYSVVPSEMPVSFGLEALKVQAVCARSYAYNQLLSNRYQSYGAHVDDSTSFQVYNNVEETALSIQAVKETEGMVGFCDGGVITAFYYSTSCGSAANYEEVWKNAEPVSYLRGALQSFSEQEIDFSQESVFQRFIREEPGVNTGASEGAALAEGSDMIEKSFAWYRWKVTIPAEILKENTGFESIQDIRVTRRGKSGIAMELTITGKATKGGSVEEKVISYQNNIRTVLAPKKATLIRQDGSEMNDMKMLPSAFFIMENAYENASNHSGQKLLSVTLYGGGYGHGVGMSQNGVKALVDRGKSFEEILMHYYDGITIWNIY